MSTATTTINTASDIPYMMSAKHLQALGFARSMVYNMMNIKGFPVLIVGKRKLVPKDKFFAWMDKQMEDPDSIFYIK